MAKLNLTRDQLATFLKNHEQIKQFEALFDAVDAIAPDVVEAAAIQAGNAGAAAAEALAQLIKLAQDAAINSGTADQKAIQALDTLGRIANTLEVLATAPAAQNNNSISTDYIDLPEDGPHVRQTRRVQWNRDDGTMDIGLYGGSVLQVGQEIMYRVQNNTGSTIPNGTICGAVGVSPEGYVRVAPYQATTLSSVKYLMGVATVDIPSGEMGYVTEFGFVRDINTAAFPAGTILYVSDTTPGAFTSTPPTAPTPRLIVALCAIQNATNGAVLIRPDFGSAISVLHDVNESGLSNNDILVYDLVQSRWENKSPLAARDALGLGTGSPSNGQILIGNGTDFTTANLTAGTGIVITNDAGAITITSTPVTGASGSFTTVDLKTVTVVNGIITSII